MTHGRSVIQSFSQLVCLGVKPTHGTCDQILLSVRMLSEIYCLVSVCALSDEMSGLSFVILSQYLHPAFTFHVFYSSAIFLQ
jgi:hypothetical protein